MGLIVLKEILSSMGGMQSMTNLTLHQIDMINCGSTLQKIVYRTIDDVRFTRVKSGRVLFKTLLDLNAINELLILLCHIKEQYNLSEEQNHLKILASRNDDLDAVSSLFTTLVTFFGTVEEIENELLPINELCTKYNAPIEVAFEIWRPILSKRSLQDNVHGLDSAKASLPDILPKEVLEFISPTLFVSFWLLSLHDINYSSELYDSEKAKLESSTRSQKDAIAINSKNKEITTATIEKNKTDLKMDEEFIKKIPVDKDEHLKHYNEVNKRLLQEAEQWFTNEEDNSQSLTVFLQYCILPRAIHSSFDALFVGRFLFKLQELRTKNFSVILLLDKLINSKLLFGTLFSSTPTEAENLGLFFSEVLGKLYSYTEESKFNTAFKDLNCVDQDGSLLTFEGFRTIVYTYHCSILQDVGDALTVEDYMCRRNAITLLKNLVGVYPNVEDHCEQVARLIENIILTEKREDLKLSSNALIGHLKSRSKEWVHLWDFIEMSEQAKEEHMKKRKAIEDQIALEKRKKREADMAKESEEKRKRIKATINYDSEQKSAPSLRPGSRKVDSRGRYDNYSNYNQKTKESNERVTKSNGEKEIKTTETKEERKDVDRNDSKKEISEVEAQSIEKDVDNKNKEGNETMEITSDKNAVDKSESDKNPQDTQSVDSKNSETQKSEKTSDIKARLSQARKEFAASNKNAEPSDTTFGDRSRSRTPLPDQKEYSKYNRTPVPTAPSRSSRGPHNSYEKSRPPLPPPPPPPPPPTQSGPRGRNEYDRNVRSRPSYNSRDGRYGKDSRDTRDTRDRENRDNRESRDGHREGYNRTDGYRNAPKSYEKRKNDGYGPNNRGYDKRQKY
jgi:THO complex subunit 2